MRVSKGKVAIALVAALSALFLWRRARKRPEQIELFYEDGSLVSVDPASAEGARMLPIAHEAVQAARGAASA